MCLLLWVAVNDAAIVEQILIEGNTATSERFIRKHIKTREGQELHQNILNEDVKRLFDLGRFENVQDKINILENGKCVISFLIIEKPTIRKIIFKGNKKVKASDLSTGIQLDKGKRFSESQIQRDLDALLKLYRDRGFIFTKIEYKIVAYNDSGEVEVVFKVEEGGQVKIGDITFVGNDHLPAKRLLKLMKTKKDRLFSKGVFDSEQFAQDLAKMQAYCQSLGYLDAKVVHGNSYYSEDKRWLYIEVRVEEGALYILDKVEIKGNKVVDTETILNILPLKVGMPYNEFARVQMEDTVVKYYGELGRVFSEAQVKMVVEEKTAHVSIVVEVEEGSEVYVEKVKIFGNIRTRDVVLRRALEFFPLERVNTEKIRRSERNLRNLGYFDKVEILPEPGSAGHMANIIVRVSEKQTGSITFSLGFSSIESVFAILKYQQRNFDWRGKEKGWTGLFTGQGFIGDGQNLEVAINTGTKSRRFTVDFSEPWVFNRKIRFGFGLFATQSEIADFDESRQGTYVTLGREFMKDLEGFLTYSISGIDVSNIDPGVSPAILEQEGHNLVSSMKNSWIFDNRDSRFMPTRGWVTELSGLMAGGPFGGTQDFYKLDAEIKKHKKLFGKEKEPHVLSARLVTGYSDAYGSTKVVPIFDRYFAGGLGSIRGFENRSLGPKFGQFEIGGEALTVMNLEYGFPISEETVRGVFFYDQGNVWEDYGDFIFDGLRSSAGVGIRVQIDALGPFPIALDFAKAVRKKSGDLTETFSFNFGNFF